MLAGLLSQVQVPTGLEAAPPGPGAAPPSLLPPLAPSAAYEFRSAGRNSSVAGPGWGGAGTGGGALNATSVEELGPGWAELIALALKGFIFGTIIISAVLGNALVIISVHRHRKLRVITNYYVVSLAMADMLVALCAMTFNASVELSGRWMFGSFMCDVWNSLDVYFSTASILHLCCISVDRYYAIVRPLEYPITMTQRTVFFMLANVWLLPALISFTPIFLGWYTTDEHRQFREANPDICVFVVNQLYAIVSSCVSFWIPGVVMITMYYRIYKEAIRQRKALSRTSSNILLNAVHLQHTSHAMHHSHHYLHPSDGDLGLTIQQVGRRGSQDNVSPNYSTFTEAIEEQRLDEVPALGVGAGPGTEPVVNFSECLNIDREREKEVSPHKSVNISCDTASSGYHSGGSGAGAGPARGSLAAASSVGAGAPHRNSRQSTSSASTAAGGTLFRDYAKAATELNTNGTSIRQQAKSWRAEHKAARTLGIIMGVFLICWLPFFLWYVITSLCGDACHCPEVVVGMLFWIGYFNSALNPLIYAYFNRDFREAFKNTLQCAFPCMHCWKTTQTTQYV